jgi:hypothetical protein
MNAWRTPDRVLSNHAEDQRTRFLVHASSTDLSAMPREPRPVQFEACPMPAHDCIRLDDEKDPLSIGPNPLQHYPKQSIRSGKPRLRMPLGQDCKLSTKRHVFQEQVAARAKEPSRQDRKKPKRVTTIKLAA